MLRTASHELTHFIEKWSPEQYRNLRNFVYDTLNSRDSNTVKRLIAAQRDNAEKAGHKLSYDEASREVVADACEMLLRDSRAVERLANENLTLAQKIRDWVSDFVNKIKKAFEGVTARTVEARILEENIKEWSEIQALWDNALEDALRSSTEYGAQGENTVESEIQHSIRYTTDNRPVVVIEENILDGVPENEWVDIVKKTMSDNFVSGIPIKGRLIKVNRITKREYLNSNDTRKYKKKYPYIYKDKLNAASQLDEIIVASTNYVNEDLNHIRKKDNFKDFARGEVLMRISNRDYKANVLVAIDGKNEMVLYDIISFESSEFTTKKEAKSFTVAPKKDINDRLDLSSTDSISQNTKNVNDDIQFSLRGEQVSSNTLAKQLKRDYSTEVSVIDIRSFIDLVAEEQNKILSNQDYEDLWGRVVGFSKGILRKSKQLDIENQVKADEKVYVYFQTKLQAFFNSC
ncbi:MAG: hypothetical protein IJZ88_05500 [Clostridia bacterium]|nr:hypothetical protein [Clostridia bacterium]